MDAKGENMNMPKPKSVSEERCLAEVKLHQEKIRRAMEDEIAFITDLKKKMAEDQVRLDKLQEEMEEDRKLLEEMEKDVADIAQSGLMGEETC
jgi:hypothetical protein